MDLEDRGVMTTLQHRAIVAALCDRKNIIIAGGTSSGKTTLANAMINSAAVCEDRLIIIEDTPELSCPAADYVRLRSRSDAPHMSAQALVKVALRLRPDRIIIGELRDGAAADLVKAWNTGHPGGLATLHANSAADAVVRLEALVLEAQTPMPRQAIIDAVDIVLFMKRIGDQRRVVELASVENRPGGGFTIAPIAAKE
jgi:type IV secretion system protein VirB11